MLLPTIHRTTERVEVVRITDPTSHLTAPAPTGEPVALGEEDPARQVRRFRSRGAAGPTCADAYRPSRARVGP
ncbi:hypothetical protein [Streptomyces noursei]|uniref:hypothetical protein n=1 Tax=Streptomyces noursei TaxID=1971 RepID=UPI00167AD610|nr:hypothetical protein [Streptomyces noursei]MCZ1020282.1 hypothetical protein [Streptomyces noursei]GGX41598.1 hypothetical protein GCM10010341_74480 [Streptomyces noursei]